MTPARKILICGLPQAGKTTLAKAICERHKGIVHLDGDAVRAATANTDFSLAGRLEQSRTMRDLADMFVKQGYSVIASFVCPTHETRDCFKADFTVWMDTLAASGYRDTNQMWQVPYNPDMVIHEFEPPSILADRVVHRAFGIPSIWDWTKPTALMVGRFQPWHAGHRALFLEALARYGQVAIGIRMMPKDRDNPYSTSQVWRRIQEDLRGYETQYVLHVLPNIAGVVYGRNVGYNIEHINLPPEIEKISATKIREGTEGVFS